MAHQKNNLCYICSPEKYFGALALISCYVGNLPVNQQYGSNKFSTMSRVATDYVCSTMEGNILRRVCLSTRGPCPMMHWDGQEGGQSPSSPHPQPGGKYSLHVSHCET